MKKISLIIPCYNVEKQVNRCLESIVSQTIGLDSLEIILINDASTDSTLSNLYNWEKRYPDNIMVITYNKNLRQGGARNTGLQYASGDYIGFVDSDDWIEPQMYEELYKAITESNADYSQCKFIRDDGNLQIIDYGSGNRSILEFMNTDGFYWGDYSERNSNNGVFGGIVTKLFKRELIYSHNIWFPEKTAYEDNYWSSIIRLYAGRICLVDRIHYHYCINTNSTTHSKNQEHHFDRLDIEVALLKKYKELGAFNTFYDKIMLDFLQRYYLNTYHILFTRFTYIPEVYSDIRNVIVHYFPDWVEICNKITPNIIQHNKLLTILATKEDCDVKELLAAYMADKQLTGDI